MKILVAAVVGIQHIQLILEEAGPCGSDGSEGHHNGKLFSEITAENVAERVAQQFGQMALVCPSSLEVVSLVVVNEVHERS